MNDTRHMRAGTGNRIALGVLILIVALFAFISTAGGFGGVGEMVSDVLVGFFGLADYAYSLAAVVVAVAVIFNFRVRMAPSRILKLSVLVLLGIWALHIYSSSGHLPDHNYGEYLTACYRGSNTAGGMLFGILSFPLMRALTTVGALVVVCAAFFILVIVFLIPTIKRDVTYTAYTPERRQPQGRGESRGDAFRSKRGARMDRQREPSITDFGGEGGGSLYVVEVDGDPMSSRNKRRQGKGAEGYDPLLYPNSDAQFEDDLRAGDRSSEFSSRSLARDLLFGREPSEETYSRYKTVTNPEDALRNPGAGFGPVRRQELMRRLGVDEVNSARDYARERYGGAEPASPASGDNAAPAERSTPAFTRDPDARGAAALGYTSFDALKADRNRTFGEMSRTGDPLREGEPRAAYPAPSAAGAAVPSVPSRREVPASPHAERRNARQTETPAPAPAAAAPAAPARPAPAAAAPAAPARPAPAESAANLGGLHGSVTRAVTGEPKAAPPAGVELPEAKAYGSVTELPADKAAAFEAAVRNAGEKARRDPTNVSAAAVIRPERTDKPAEPAAAKPAPESPAEGKNSDGETIQQSIFARQQFQAIARARGEGAEDLIKEENAKRKRAPVRERPDKNAKTEDKPKENGARVSQVHIDQEIAKATSHKPYVAPPMSLLAPPEGEVSQQEDYEFKKQQLCDTLAFFDIQSEVTDIRVGPTFSLYTLKVEMPRGSRISSINNLDDDIAMRMEESSVRIIAPIPGKNAVGIEVPNKYRRIVRLSEIVGSPEFNSAPSPSTFALGVDLYGKKFACDVASLPHMLIAGATGAGKSCCINSLIISLLYKASPDDVRMILIDPKRVELSVYAGIPHLMLDEIVCDVDKAIRALNWAIQEMERRIAYLSSIKYSNIEDYNRDCEKLGYPKMPRIVIIVDELADLMAQGKKAVEDAINRLARLARAMGIHLILATQRPSVDVVSGTIKNNLPTRVAFRVTSGPDSRTVLDAGGAEKLLGNGDLLYMHPKNSDFVRMQGAFITPQEIKSVVEFVIANNESVYDSSVKDAIFKDPAETAEHKIEKGSAHKVPGVPPEVFAAARIGLDGTPLTISSLQRKLNLGFPKAARVVDIMKDMGIVEYNNDDKKYHVVISEEELDALENGDKTDPEDGGEES